VGGTATTGTTSSVTNRLCVVIRGTSTTLMKLHTANFLDSSNLSSRTPLDTNALLKGSQHLGPSPTGLYPSPLNTRNSALCYPQNPFLIPGLYPEWSCGESMLSPASTRCLQSPPLIESDGGSLPHPPDILPLSGTYEKLSREHMNSSGKCIGWRQGF